jgi:hypothetical protein
MMMFGFGWLIMLLLLVLAIVLIVLLVGVAAGWFKDWNKSTLLGQNQPPMSSPPMNYTPIAPQADRYCSHCGAGLQSDWTHCPQCGAPIQ